MTLYIPIINSHEYMYCEFNEHTYCFNFSGCGIVG